MSTPQATADAKLGWYVCYVEKRIIGACKICCVICCWIIFRYNTIWKQRVICCGGDIGSRDRLLEMFCDFRIIDESYYDIWTLRQIENHAEKKYIDWYLHTLLCRVVIRYRAIAPIIYHTKFTTWSMCKQPAMVYSELCRGLLGWAEIFHN